MNATSYVYDSHERENSQDQRWPLETISLSPPSSLSLCWKGAVKLVPIDCSSLVGMVWRSQSIARAQSFVFVVVVMLRIPYTVLLLLWGGIFGALYTELDDPFNPALNNVS